MKSPRAIILFKLGLAYIISVSICTIGYWLLFKEVKAGLFIVSSIPIIFITYKNIKAKKLLV
jgi:hypothetical protein